MTNPSPVHQAAAAIQIPVLTKPLATDPRFPKERGEQAPDTRATERLTANPLRCDRGGCETKIHVQLQEPQKRIANAITHGFMRGEGGKNHLVYCSRRCRDMDAPAGLKVGDPCPKPHCMREGLSVGRCYCKPQIGGPVAQCPVTRVTVRDTNDRQGVAHRAIICDRWGCQEKQYVDPKTTPERICQIAHTAGFRQRDYGTCCSEQCARMLGADVRAGRQPSIATQQAGTKHITTAEPVAVPPPVAPEPRPAPSPRGEYGIWCYERAAYVPTSADPWSGDAQAAELRVAHLRQQAVAEGEFSTYAVRLFASAEPPAMPNRKARRAIAAAAPRG
jgi:hypothetical protein